MIPVSPAPEPSTFDEEVRNPGLCWLAEKGWAANEPPAKAGDLPPHWQKVSKDLWSTYGGVCAYLAVYFPYPLGAHSTDHFVAKSKNAGLAYEWSNYRLSCLGANRRKGRFDDILDPFEIDDHTFELNLASGEISPNPGNSEDVIRRAEETILRLRLNDPMTKEMRAQQYEDYCRGDISVNYLERNSPFVHYEATRQGLL